MLHNSRKYPVADRRSAAFLSPYPVYPAFLIIQDRFIIFPRRAVLYHCAHLLSKITGRESLPSLRRFHIQPFCILLHQTFSNPRHIISVNGLGFTAETFRLYDFHNLLIWLFIQILSPDDHIIAFFFQRYKINALYLSACFLISNSNIPAARCTIAPAIR